MFSLFSPCRSPPFNSAVVLSCGTVATSSYIVSPLKSFVSCRSSAEHSKCVCVCISYSDEGPGLAAWGPPLWKHLAPCCRAFIMVDEITADILKNKQRGPAEQTKRGNRRFFCLGPNTLRSVQLCLSFSTFLHPFLHPLHPVHHPFGFSLLLQCRPFPAHDSVCITIRPHHTEYPAQLQHFRTTWWTPVC